MLGTDDVDWNAQKFILGKKYTDNEDSNLVAKCDSAYRLGKFSIVSFIFIFITFIVNGALSS